MQFTITNATPIDEVAVGFQIEETDNQSPETVHSTKTILEY